MFDLSHPNGIHKKTQNNRWRRQHDVCHKAGHTGGFALITVLCQINPGQDTNRCADQSGKAHHHQASDDGIGQAAALGTGCRCGLGEHGPVDGLQAVFEQHEQYPQQHKQAQCHGQHGQSQTHLIGQAPAFIKIQVHDFSLALGFRAFGFFCAGHHPFGQSQHHEGDDKQ